MRHPASTLGWGGIVRLGLVQSALGAIIVLTTSTMNRVMVVELALPAIVPGVLVGLHHVVQLLRPRLGHGSDVGGRRTPWIIGGMAVLALGGIAAALATAWMATDRVAGTLLGVAAFVAIGIGAGATGTSLLVLLAKRVDPDKRAAAATIVWVMMIAGFIVTSATAGHFLDPFSTARLVMVTTCVALVAFAVAVIAVHGVEGRVANHRAAVADAAARGSFRDALAEVWAQPQARRFTIFVFVSMLAYSMQDLIIEPFAGLVFGFTPGESTKLSGVQNGGVLLGMALVGIIGTLRRRAGDASMRNWTMAGCFASAIALFGLVIGGLTSPGWPLRPTVFALGIANGAFAVSAIGSMMALAGAARDGREGVRMGLWGAAQAIAFAAGGVVGTAAVDIARQIFDAPVLAYTAVFAAEGLVFLVAARLAAQVCDMPCEAAEASPHREFRYAAKVAE
jgi:BCD family chlorophyll transporter-like MFS transporter